jgi:anti-sigma B factor antagonist
MSPRFARTAPFAIRQIRHGDAIVLSLRGELDYPQAEGLEAAVEAAELEQPPVLVIDLADVSFVDAAGMRVMHEAAQRAARDGRELVVSGAAPDVRRVFELVGLERVASAPATRLPR